MKHVLSHTEISFSSQYCFIPHILIAFSSLQSTDLKRKEDPEEGRTSSGVFKVKTFHRKYREFMIHTLLFASNVFCLLHDHIETIVSNVNTGNFEKFLSVWRFRFPPLP